MNRIWRVLAVFQLFLLTCLTGLANTDLREWKSANGEHFEAEFMRYDVEGKRVYLRLPNAQEITREYNDLSAVDRAWILEWLDMEKKLSEKLEQLGGTLKHYQAKGNRLTDCYVYFPKSDSQPGGLPLLILFHPGGKGMQNLLRHVEAAEDAKLILVSLDVFQNTGNDAAKEAELLALFRQLLPIIERTVPHDPLRMFMGGESGGAWRAFHFAAQTDRPWAGIYSGGGWLGGPKYHDLPYPSGLRIAMVNGHLDKAANYWVETDGKILERRGGEVGVFAFEGAHQVAPVEVQIKAFRWLLKKDSGSKRN